MWPPTSASVRECSAGPLRGSLLVSATCCKRSGSGGVGGFGARRVDRLSGGEKKRVALARSLAPEPALLLLDEPLTGLDRELHDRLIVELGDVLRSTGTTAILVSHDRDEAAALAGRIVTWHDLQPV